MEKFPFPHSAFLTLLLLAGCGQQVPEEISLVYNDLPAIVDFNFHVKPILSDRCYKCHGPDDNAREADFRLDIEEKAFAKLKESGGHAFVKGNIGKSVAWKRITSEDQEFHMPPPESNLRLSAKEKALITKWIEQGAEWKPHWSFIAPQRAEIPKDLPADWTVNNPVDNFILGRLKEQGLSPSPEADKEHLIRRLSFDLTGLPPSLGEIDSFIMDNSPEAYEKLVDRLLSADAHAERMALEWLDVARYGDTQGMHGDAERYHWPWRDWVIKVFKENMPYDDFITWQLAGDLLPNATRDQKLATAFHRNHPVSAEGGIIDEEFRVKYVQDRTNTTATAFLGLTLECATCHDHKFDPISQKEYYQMSAFFNNLKELGMVGEGGGSSGPVLLLPEPETEEKLARLSEEIDQTYEQLELTKSEVAATEDFIASIQSMAIDPPVADGFYPMETVRPDKIYGESNIRVMTNSPIDKIVDENLKSVASGEPQVVKGRFGNALRLEQEIDLVFLKDVGNFEMNQPFSAGGWIHTEKEGENQSIMGTSGGLLNYWRGWDLFIDTLNRPSVRMTSFWPHNYMQITADISVPKAEWHHILYTYDGSGQASGIHLYVDGRKIKCSIDYNNLYRPIVHKWKKQVDYLGKGWRERPVMVGSSGRLFTGDNGAFYGSIDHLKIFNRYLTSLEVAALFVEETKVSPSQTDRHRGDGYQDKEANYIDHYLNRKHSGYRSLIKELQKLLGKKLVLLEDVPEIMVMEDMPEPRKTFVLKRGQYNSPTEEVGPGTLRKVLAFAQDLPKNRLGLARWLVDKNNPLTARVTVNRYWQMIFGRGIVETPQDFGTQGALPTHPELLDWLAINFMESGWDLRDLLKTIVTSATYRQSSVASPENSSKDAKNLFLARGPSYRLPAEMIRDNALAASGLLTQMVGGPSVKPYQPKGLWVEKTGSHRAYKPNSGDSLYRRSMYTYIRRTIPHPAMIAFDAPTRSVCVVKRENTNTPLQALVLLNDPQFVETARVLAQRIQKEGGESLEDQTQYGFRLLCGRKPDGNEMELMKKQYQIALDKYKGNPKAADELLQVGEYPFDNSLDRIQTVALAMVASTVMNFDEAYMKR